MKRTCSLILVLILSLSLFESFFLTANASASVYGAGKVATESTALNVRKSASTSASVVTTLKRNSSVTLINKTGNFWYVRYSASGYGYCSADYITVTSKTTKKVKVSSGRLNIRSSASTSAAIVGKLENGAVIPVISSSGNWSKILYNGTKTGYVSSAYLTTSESGNTATSYKAISLSGVPNFKQTDSRWANVTLGSSGQSIAKIGCATTAIAMLESKRTGTTIYPHTMSKKLSYTSGGAVYWPSYYTQITSSTGYLSKLYSLLRAGKPVIIGAKKSNGGQHYVVVTGVKATESLKTSDFYINDPGSNSRTTLNQFFSAYPYFYKMLHY
ncbi:MAG: SH3 domain-containing protein [Clostridia bacterium]|nr:SH3 domain-containing protein [Clostridia bacterium]